jgi:hypothetical protein
LPPRRQPRYFRFFSPVAPCQIVAFDIVTIIFVAIRFSFSRFDFDTIDYFHCRHFAFIFSPLSSRYFTLFSFSFFRCFLYAEEAFRRRRRRHALLLPPPPPPFAATIFAMQQTPRQRREARERRRCKAAGSRAQPRVRDVTSECAQARLRVSTPRQAMVRAAFSIDAQFRFSAVFACRHFHARRAMPLFDMAARHLLLSDAISPHYCRYFRLR